MGKITIENTTHWQSRDIGKLMRAVAKHANYKSDLPVKVDFANPGNSYGEWQWDGRKKTLIVNLPKRGPKADPLTSLAATAVTDEPILAPHVIYCLARTLAIALMEEIGSDIDLKPKFRKRHKELCKMRTSRARPAWLPKDMFIKRYAKKKPPTRKSFLEKVEEALERAEARVEDWESQLEHAEAMLKRAQRDLKKEQKRLRDARKRAEERGESVEFIGPGHRLYGRI